MTAGGQPKGLQKRTAAAEGRLAQLEADLAALQTAYARAAPSTGPAALDGIAQRLAGLQAEYDAALLALRELHAMTRRLRDWGLAPADTASWARVCRVLEHLTRADGAHRAIRSREPVLHVLLHRCALPPYCSLDGVSYQQ